jgi:hypothetical protein
MTPASLHGKGFGKVVQIAYLVPDLDKAMDQWLQLAGVGPWTCFRNIDLEATYLGQPLRLKIHEALSYIGDLQIQLVQSLNAPETITPYSDYLRAGRYGVHHVAFLSNNIDADIARADAQGFDPVCRMQSADGHRYYYCRSRTMPEVWCEFLEVFPLLTQVFKEGIARSAHWDGTNAVTNIEYADLLKN